MTCEKKFYKCGVCGNIVDHIHVGGGTLVCCGQNMNLLVPNTVEASTEKHIPVVAVSGTSATVNVGSVPHPMVEDHFIQWIYFCTSSKGILKYLNPGDAPEATFCLTEGAEGTAYAYCNLHGLWSADF
jgi:superoxide reductase